MKHTTLARRALSLAVPFVLLAAIAINAQIAGQFAQSQQQNSLALRAYEWKSRMEVQKDGETKKVQLSQMHYDSAGNVQKTVISSTPEPDMPKFGIRRLVGKKKLGDFKEKLEELGALAQSYSQLSPDTMQRFMTNATITPEMTAQHKLIRIEGRSVLQPNDVMTIFIDAGSRKQRRVEIQTSLDGKPVQIISAFQDLPQGPTYMGRSEVSYEGNSLVIITENFDYARVR
jgi:hypothetical protein